MDRSIGRNYYPAKECMKIFLVTSSWIDPHCYLIQAESEEEVREKVQTFLHIYKTECNVIEVESRLDKNGMMCVER